MSLPLTSDRLAAIYEALRAFPPFSRWNLPHADSVEFHVTRHRDRFADWSRYTRGPKKGTHIIRVSSSRHDHFEGLVMTVAHEMIHAAQAIAGTATNAEHNSDFLRRAVFICRRFGWDRVAFNG